VSTPVLRLVLVVASVAGIAGMIVSSIGDKSGPALAFGLLTGGAATALILVTSVERRREPADVELHAEVLEQRVNALVASGADEARVRALVADAVRLGRAGG
jgi:hypothetical protein